MKRHARSLIAFLLLVCSVIPALATPAADRKAARTLGDRIEKLRQDAGIPGLAVVVLRDTSVLLARGYGYANVEARLPMTVETPSNIASVAKPISAVLAMRLVERGQLDLDRSMRSFADFDEYCEAMHDEGGVFFGDLACRDSALTLRHVLAMVSNGAPGTRFLYNPPVYSWASRPIAQSAGAPFSTLVDSLVLKPAGMINAARTFRRRPLPEALAARLAQPYHRDSTGALVRSTPPPPQGDGAAGGVIASAMDLARFDRALMRDQLITPASRAAMWQPTCTPSGDVLPYALGWFTRVIEGRRLVWHTGLWEERYSALYLKLPDEQLTIILLANSEGLQWKQGLDEAAIERSPFATAFLKAFPVAAGSR